MGMDETPSERIEQEIKKLAEMIFTERTWLRFLRLARVELHESGNYSPTDAELKNGADRIKYAHDKKKRDSLSMEEYENLNKYNKHEDWLSAEIIIRKRYGIKVQKPTP